MDNNINKIPDTPSPSALKPTSRAPGHSWLKIFGIVVVACIVSTLVAVTAVYFFLFPGPFKPVDLSTKEEQALEQKLDRLGSLNRTPSTHKSQDKHGAGGSFKPEKYTESDADREITLTEREINALLAKNTDLAEKLVIDLSEDMASAKLRIPLDEDFPFIGGKTLKVSAGLEMSYRAGRPVVVLRGVSLWGVPLPNAWLGNIKNIDMVKEFGAEQGFWKAFADGVDEIEIRDGQLRVKLNE